MKSIAAFGLAVLIPGLAQPCMAQVKPIMDRITLEVDRQTFEPMHTQAAWVPLHWFGQRAFSLKDNTITEISPNDGSALWTLKSSDKSKLAWIDAAGETAYLMALDAEDNDVTTPKPLILRCDLTTKKWLPHLSVSDGGGTMVDALVSPQRVAVMTVHNGKDDKNGDYRIFEFASGQDKPAWSKTFPLPPERPGPGVYLLAASMPDFAHARIAHLAWAGDDVLACGGEKSDLLYLDSAGKTVWSIPQIWEFQRGFIGPSVWSHYISRLGLERTDSDVELGPPKDAPGETREQKEYKAKQWQEYSAQRAAFDDQFQCAIIGGPAVVPAPTRTNPHDFSIFIAVAKGPQQRYAGYLSECSLYEINSRGKVVAMTSLPRLVNGSQFVAGAAGLTWACQQDSMVRIQPRAQLRFAGMGRDNDCLCNIDWYRQFQLQPASADAWLTVGKVGQVAALSDNLIWVAASGGSVPANNHHLFRFAITLIDQKTGADRTATLNVPVDGEVQLPKTNYSMMTDDHGQHVTTTQPYLLGITGLEIHDSTLEIVLGGEGFAAGVTFDGKMFKAAP